MSGYPIDRRIKHATLNAFKADKIPVDSTYFDNTGSLITPKTTITQQGNTFNSANQLVQLDANLRLPAVDGSNLTNVLAQGLSPTVPYSVNSAKKDANGYASFITKIDNSTIGFDTNSGTTPIVLTYPDGSAESSATLPNITITLDFTFFIIKEKNTAPYLTALIPVEQYTAPSSPTSGQLWLDISQVPYVPKKWNGTSWFVTQFVKLGEFTRTAGVIGTPISYALNGMYYYQGTTPLNCPITINHNLGCKNYDTSEMMFENVVNFSSSFTVGAFYPCLANRVVSTVSDYTMPAIAKKIRTSCIFSYEHYLSIMSDDGYFYTIQNGNTNFRPVLFVKRNF